MKPGLSGLALMTVSTPAGKAARAAASERPVEPAA